MTLGLRTASFALPVAALLAFALTLAPVANAEEILQSQADEAAEDPFAESPDDSLGGSDVQVPREPAPGGDVRLVGARGITAALSPRAGARHVGSGWPGHRTSLARGPLPTTLTEVTMRGRWADDWVDEGLDLLAATSPASGVLLTPGGPDLSLWPVYTAEWPLVSSCGASPLAIDVRALRRPAVPPFSRVTVASGSFDRSLLGAEFGRDFAGGSALAGYFETEDGRAPSAGGSYGFDRAGGEALFDIEGDWTAEVGGMRVALDRSRPTAGAAPALAREYVRTDLFVRGSSERIRLEMFHTQSWLESNIRGPAVRAEVDGLSASILQAGPIDAVSLQLERRAVSGALLSESRGATGLRVEASETFRAGANSIAVVAGAHMLGGEVVPRASAVMTREQESPGQWKLDVSLWGRHPTALELELEPRPLPGSAGEFIGGNRHVGPERAAALGATYERRDFLSGAGVRGELVRVVDPIVPDSSGTSLFTPVNAASETGAVAAAWAVVGDTSGVSGGLDVAVFGLDAAGALNRLTPVPILHARAEVSTPLELFDGYVRVRVAAAMEYEYGLARGQWSGLLDDDRSALALAVTGEVDSVRFFVTLDDVLSGDSARVPGMEPGGTTLSAGLSWRFRD